MNPMEKFGVMSAASIVVEGTVKPDGTLVMDQLVNYQQAGCGLLSSQSLNGRKGKTGGKTCKRPGPC